jgi:chromosomal replication initiator protein
VLRSNQELWEETLDAIKTTLDGHSYQSYFKDLEFVGYNRRTGAISLAVKGDFQQAMLETRFSKLISSSAEEIFEKPVNISFLPLDKTADLAARKRATGNVSELFPDGDKLFNPRLSFDNFIVGDNSRFAAGAAKAVAEDPLGTSYSPLFIYGDSGLGKTHLMHAIGLHIWSAFPEIKVLYVSSETFTDEYVNAVRTTDSMARFKEKYRRADVLLIDDIQFISGKEKTEEEVFNTFNTLYGMRKLMVFSSDRPPQNILGIDERLKSRLNSGLSVDLQPPSYEVKVAILKNKALLDKVPAQSGLSDVISFIAETVKSNVRELEGAFNRVVFYSSATGAPMNKALAKQVLKDIVTEQDRAPSPKDIRKAVASFFGIQVADLDSADRSRTFARPRQIAVFLCYEMTNLSFPKIADIFSKDYATVHYAHKKVQELIKNNSQFEIKINELTKKIEEEY